MKTWIGYLFCIALAGCASNASDRNSSWFSKSSENGESVEAGSITERTISEVKYAMIPKENPDSEDLFFDVRITHENQKGDLLKALSTDHASYEEILKYCAFGIEKDFKLVSNNGDTIPCSYCHFERTYGLSPGLSFQTAFKRPAGNFDDVTVILDDKIFDHGNVKFYFTQDALKHHQ